MRFVQNKRNFYRFLKTMELSVLCMPEVCELFGSEMHPLVSIWYCWVDQFCENGQAKFYIKDDVSLRFLDRIAKFLFLKTKVSKIMGLYAEITKL